MKKQTSIYQLVHSVKFLMMFEVAIWHVYVNYLVRKFISIEITNLKQCLLKITSLFIIDSLNEAENYSINQRKISPKSYTTQKQIEVFENSAASSDDSDSHVENKEAVKETIEKMRKMNDIFIDLSDSDIEDFQEILGGNGDIADDPDLYFPELHPMSVNAQPNCNSENDANTLDIVNIVNASNASQMGK